VKSSGIDIMGYI